MALLWRVQKYGDQTKVYFVMNNVPIDLYDKQVIATQVGIVVALTVVAILVLGKGKKAANGAP